MPYALPDERRYLFAAWLIVGVMVVGCAIGVIVPAGLGWDFGNFYDAGHRIAAGQVNDLYDSETRISGEAPQGKMKFWGTPISAALYAPLSWFPPTQALILFKLENVAALAAGLIIAFRFYRRLRPVNLHARFGALFALLCLMYQPFWTVFRVGGQTTPTMFALLALGLVLHTRERLWGSAACFVAAALIKPVLAPALIVLALVSGVSYLRRTAILLIAAGVVSLLTMGWPVHEAFLRRVLGEVQDIYPWPYNSSLYVFLGSARAAAGGAEAPGLVTLVFGAAAFALKAAVAGTIGYLLILSRRQGWPVAARRHFDFLMALLFFLLWSPTLWEHYLAMLFLPLLYVVASSSSFSRGALRLVGAIFLLCIGQNLILMDLVRSRFSIDSPVELMTMGLFKSAPLMLTLVFLWKYRAALLRSFSVPAWHAPVTVSAHPAEAGVDHAV